MEELAASHHKQHSEEEEEEQLSQCDLKGRRSVSNGRGGAISVKCTAPSTLREHPHHQPGVCGVAGSRK